MRHLSYYPTLRTYHSDTILRAIKELTQENISYTSDQELSDIIDKIYTDGFEDGEESTETSQDKPKTKQIPKSPMKQGKIHQAQEYLKEIKELVENPDIHITSEFDLDSLDKAKNYIKAFIQKQQYRTAQNRDIHK